MRVASPLSRLLEYQKDVTAVGLSGDYAHVAVAFERDGRALGSAGDANVVGGVLVDGVAAGGRIAADCAARDHSAAFRVAVPTAVEGIVVEDIRDGPVFERAIETAGVGRGNEGLVETGGTEAGGPEKPVEEEVATEAVHRVAQEHIGRAVVLDALAVSSQAFSWVSGVRLKGTSVPPRS